jgi:glycosyltransferase involved in cell wall biosynthesis
MTYTQFVKDDVAKFAGINPGKINVTPLSAEPITDASTPLPSLQNKKFIMYVGRPMPHKNLDRLVQAFALVKAKHPELVLVLAGKKDANYARLEASVKTQGLENVLFTDFVSEGTLRWLYENCQAYVFPSLSEGFGLPGLEAMLQGAPVVSSNFTCLPEVYGEGALYFDPLDVGSIADTINEVLADETLRTKLIEKGRLQAGKYSWQHLAEQTLEVYKQALGD